MQISHASHGNFLGATVEIPQVKLIFNPQTTILTCNQYLKMNMFFLLLYFDMQYVCYSTSQFGLATFQVLSSHMELVAAEVDSTAFVPAGQSCLLSLPYFLPLPE